jgi:hypothetical protein
MRPSILAKAIEAAAVPAYCEGGVMRARFFLVTVLAVTALAAGRATPATSAEPLKTCGSGYVHAKLSWGEKCLRAGQFCTIKGDREYHRYGFHCHTGHLSRSSAGGNKAGAGCQPGYTPCLPRVADLNCSDIDASKKPIHVTGADPYRLDADGDGLACEP